MRWAIKRQLLIAIGILAIVIVIAGGIGYAFFYHPPSCLDRIQNQGEEGIDCGGPCALLCQAPQVSALWARSVEVAPGVYHAVAMVQNPESDAGTTGLPYVFQLFDSDNVLVAERSGTMTLHPGDVIPVFQANIVTGNRTPARTFITFGNAVWTKMPRPAMPLSITSRSLDQSTLTLSAHVVNTAATPAPDARLVALLYDADGVLVAASQTTIPGLAGEASRDIVFTWQEPFSAPVVRTEIVPLIP